MPKKMTLKELRAECRKKGLIYDLKKKDCREKKKRNTKTTTKTSPPALKPHVKKPTLKELREMCSKRGYVLDPKTKICRPSKTKKRTGGSIKSLREACKLKGLVLDTKTKKCRESKRKKKKKPVTTSHTKIGRANHTRKFKPKQVTESKQVTEPEYDSDLDGFESAISEDEEEVTVKVNVKPKLKPRKAQFVDISEQYELYTLFRDEGKIFNRKLNAYIRDNGVREGDIIYAGTESMKPQLGFYLVLPDFRPGGRVNLFISTKDIIKTILRHRGALKHVSYQDALKQINKWKNNEWFFERGYVKSKSAKQIIKLFKEAEIY